MSVTTITRLASFDEVVAEMDRRGAVIETLECTLTRVTAERDEAVSTLRLAEAAMSEFYRYWHGGETRGSYNGRPERDALFRAMHAARTALSRLSRKDTDNG